MQKMLPESRDGAGVKGPVLGVRLTWTSFKGFPSVSVTTPTTVLWLETRTENVLFVPLSAMPVNDRPAEFPFQSSGR